MLTALQIRQARALLGWTSETLSERAKVGIEKVLKAQHERAIQTVSPLDLEMIQRAFGQAGLGTGTQSRQP